MKINAHIEVLRDKRSYLYDAKKLAPVWLDKIKLWANVGIVYSSKCQSVAIYNCSVLESIAPMKFECRLFAEQRSYANPVHELINAIDMEGEEIDGKAMQIDAEAGIQGRWLIHDDYNPLTKKAYNIPWSAGCIMLPFKEHKLFNDKLIELGCNPGDIIPIEIKEV